jgi:hypothetical protein
MFSEFKPAITPSKSSWVLIFLNLAAISCISFEMPFSMSSGIFSSLPVISAY